MNRSELAMNGNGPFENEPSDEMWYDQEKPRRVAFDKSHSSNPPDPVREGHKALAQEVAKRLVDSGLIRTWLPQATNGAKTPPTIMLYSADSAAHGKVSTDWCVLIAIPSGTLQADPPPKRRAAKGPGSPRSVSVSVWAPGDAETAERDFGASGRWSFYGDLQPDNMPQAQAQVQAALHKALTEWVTGLRTPKIDDGTKPRSAPSLAQAAKDLVHDYLAEAQLSPAMLARQLNVSVRTLQRAFAATGDSVTAYIRHQRLEQARLVLTSPHGRPSVSELAAYWQFADSSHFIKAFKQRYGQTPAQYARSHSDTPASSPNTGASDSPRRLPPVTPNRRHDAVRHTDTDAETPQRHQQKHRKQ